MDQRPSHTRGDKFVEPLGLSLARPEGILLGVPLGRHSHVTRRGFKRARGSVEVASLRVNQPVLTIYPLVNGHITMEHHHVIAG